MTQVGGGIERPIEEVFDFAVDERNEPLYNPRMRLAELVTAGPVGAGTRFHSEVVSGGRTVPMEGEITAYERPRRYALTVNASVMDIRGDVNFDHVPVGTQMRWSWDVEPRGPFKLVSPIMAVIGRRQEIAIWTGLKRLLEQRNGSRDPKGPLDGTKRHVRRAKSGGGSNGMTREIVSSQTTE